MVMNKRLGIEVEHYATIMDLQIGIIIPLLVLPGLIWSMADLGQGSISFISLIYILTFLYLINIRRVQRIAVSKPLLIWMTLTAYHLINATIKHVSEINYVDYLAGIKCYASICIFTYFLSVNAKLTLKILFYTFGLWLLGALMITGYSAGHRLTGEKL